MCFESVLGLLLVAVAVCMVTVFGCDRMSLNSLYWGVDAPVLHPLRTHYAPVTHPSRTRFAPENMNILADLFNNLPAVLLYNSFQFCKHWKELV